MSSASPERTYGTEFTADLDDADLNEADFSAAEFSTADSVAGLTSVRIEQPDELVRWAAGLDPSPYAQDWQGFQRSLAGRLPDLPAELAEPVRAFRGRLGRAGALHLRGLPVPAELGPTPAVPFVQLRQPIGTEPYLVAIGLVLGEVFGFADWHGGDRVQNMYPLPSEASAQNANNSVYLHLHTETAFRAHTPDALVLLCLRSDPGAVTVFADLASAAATLGPELYAQLGRPAFAFSTPTDSAGPPHLTEPKPIFDGRRWNYAEALVGIDEAAEQALAAIGQALREQARPIALQAGEALVLDNLHIVHGRSAYRPSYRGTDRWLQRCLVRVPGPITGRGSRAA